MEALDEYDGINIRRVVVSRRRRVDAEPLLLGNSRQLSCFFFVSIPRRSTYSVELLLGELGGHLDCLMVHGQGRKQSEVRLFRYFEFKLRPPSADPPAMRNGGTFRPPAGGGLPTYLPTLEGHTY